jgi:hypothetical protein
LPINPFSSNSISNLPTIDAAEINTLTRAIGKSEPFTILEASLEASPVSEQSPTMTLTTPKAALSASPLCIIPGLPLNSPFEIRDTLGKGYGIFSTVPIVRGTRLLAEEPLLRINKTHYMAKDVESAVEQLPKEKQMRYWALASAHGQDASRSVPSLLEKRQMLVDVLKTR